MEYIDGDNLEQLIKKNALSAELARKIAGQPDGCAGIHAQQTDDSSRPEAFQHHDYT
ncbi:MAG: hypothetical protein ACLRYB_16465 [Segatella copri]